MVSGLIMSSKKNFLHALFDDINFLITFWSDPCDAPFTVYLEALYPALFKLFFEYLAIDPKQIVRTRFKSSFKLARGRTYRKGRVGRKSNKFRWFKKVGRVLNFDHNEILGKKLWGWEEKEATKLTAKSTTLFIAEGVLNRLVYWMWIVSLVHDFLINWTSLMINTKYCQAKFDAVLLAEGPDQGQNPLFGWTGLLFWTIKKQRGHVSWNGAAGSFDTLKGNWIVSTTARNDGDDPAVDCSLRVTVTHPFAPTKVEEEKFTLAKGETRELSLTGDLVQGDDVLVEVRILSGHFIAEKPTIYIQGSAGDPLQPDINPLEVVPV